MFYDGPGPIRDRTSLNAVGYSTIANIPSTATCPAEGDQNGGRSGFLSIDSRGLVHRLLLLRRTGPTSVTY